MTDDRLQTEVKVIRKQIVQALEHGRDPGPLLKRLGQVRAQIIQEVEQVELEQVAGQRRAVRDTASQVREKVRQQEAAIDSFLSARDSILKQLQPAAEPLRQLAANSKWCFAFAGRSQLDGVLGSIPAELLGQDFRCPALRMAPQTREGNQRLARLVSGRAHGKAAEALSYFEACCSILSAFTKGCLMAWPLGADESPSLAREPEATQCLVCSHTAKEAIDEGLKALRSLRELEREFAVSRSTLSRHRRKCLGREAVKIAE